MIYAEINSSSGQLVWNIPEACSRGIDGKASGQNSLLESVKRQAEEIVRAKDKNRIVFKDIGPLSPQVPKIFLGRFLDRVTKSHCPSRRRVPSPSLLYSHLLRRSLFFFAGARKDFRAFHRCGGATTMRTEAADNGREPPENLPGQ